MGNIIEILDNVIVIDDQHYISRYNNSVMSKNSKGIVFVNGNEQLQVAYEGTTIDGDGVTSIDDLFTKLQSLFKSNSSSGGGAVESVMGNLVDNTDPSNPVIDNPLLESHQVIITDGSTRSLTDFNGTLFLVTNGVDPATVATFNWNGLDENTRKLTIVFTFNLPAITHTVESGVTIRRLPTSAQQGDAWTVVYDKFYNTWDLASSNRIGTNRQVQGFADGETKPVIIGVPHLTDIGGFPSFANGVLTATSMNSVTQTALLSFIEFSTNTPKAGTFVMYTTGGRLLVSEATVDGEAVNLGQLNTRVPNIGGGTNNFLRLATNGTYSFEEACRDLGITAFTANFTITRAYMSGNRCLTFDGTDLAITIPESASFTAGFVFRVINRNVSPIAIVTTGTASLISVENLTHIAGHGEVWFTCLGGNVWKASGELTAI